MNRDKEKNDLFSSLNISYYDMMASQYDSILNVDKKNISIRNRVAEFFVSQVKYGHVVDFGGGTGLDLNWLAKQQYNISFCEPSEAMRMRAINRCRAAFPDSPIVFLESYQSNFRTWSAEFPFRQKVNAVLANFAVFNCIPDIRMLFEKLALVLSPGGTIVALVLDASPARKLRANFKGTIGSVLTNKPVGFHIDFNGERQLVNLYSSLEIRKAARDHFHLVLHKRLSGLGFNLIHLIKK